MLDEVKQLERLALTMGFQHEDIILFENLTRYETIEAILYRLLLIFIKIVVK